ncbi:hypothetical protein Bbelb_132730 [Branchiostoma belcheri]|nr:hypothetical protein Bbelb_132730 [Branchiostoma belcheri]
MEVKIHYTITQVTRRALFRDSGAGFCDTRESLEHRTATVGSPACHKSRRRCHGIKPGVSPADVRCCKKKIFARTKKKTTLAGAVSKSTLPSIPVPRHRNTITPSFSEHNRDHIAFSSGRFIVACSLSLRSSTSVHGSQAKAGFCGH